MLCHPLGGRVNKACWYLSQTATFVYLKGSPSVPFWILPPCYLLLTHISSSSCFPLCYLQALCFILQSRSDSPHPKRLSEPWPLRFTCSRQSQDVWIQLLSMLIHTDRTTSGPLSVFFFINPNLAIILFCLHTASFKTGAHLNNCNFNVSHTKKWMQAYFTGLFFLTAQINSWWVNHPHIIYLFNTVVCFSSCIFEDNLFVLVTPSDWWGPVLAGIFRDHLISYWDKWLQYFILQLIWEQDKKAA